MDSRRREKASSAKNTVRHSDAAVGSGQFVCKVRHSCRQFLKRFHKSGKNQVEGSVRSCGPLQHRSVPVAFHLLSGPELSFLPDFNFCLPDGRDRPVRLIGDHSVKRDRRDSYGWIAGGKVTVRLGLPFWIGAGTPLQGPVCQVSDPFLDAIYQVRDLCGTCGPSPLLPQPKLSAIFLPALPGGHDRISDPLGDNQRHHRCGDSFRSACDTLYTDHLSYGTSPVLLQGYLPAGRLPIGFQPFRCCFPGTNVRLHRVRDLQQGVSHGDHFGSEGIRRL